MILKPNRSSTNPTKGPTTSANERGKIMLTKTLVAVAAISLGSLAQASGYNTSQQIGNTSYYSGSYGSGTSQRIGNTTYHSGSYGIGTSQRIGNTTYHNGSFGSGTSQRIGNTTYHNGSYGSGTSQRIGNTTFDYWYD